MPSCGSASSDSSAQAEAFARDNCQRGSLDRRVPHHRRLDRVTARPCHFELNPNGQRLRPTLGYRACEVSGFTPMSVALCLH